MERIQNAALTAQYFSRVTALRQPSAPVKMLFYACEAAAVQATLSRGVCPGDGVGGIVQRVVTTTTHPARAFLYTKGPDGSYHSQVCPVCLGERVL